VTQAPCSRTVTARVLALQQFYPATPAANGQ
jgi:hypothetical protein